MVPERYPERYDPKMSGSKKKRAPLVADKRYGKQAAKPAARKPAKPRKTRRKSTRRPGLIGFIAAFIGAIFRMIWRFFFGGAVIVAVMIALGVFYFASTMPPADQVTDGRAKGSVTLADRNGEVFAWRGDQFGGPVTVASVSPHLVNAVVAQEDKRFYGHLGVSPRGIASAVRINLRAGRGPLSGNGGSTITQQVAKLLCLGVPYDPDVWETEAAYEADCRRNTIWRKVKEAVYAMGMEVAYTKDEILSIYLNRAYLGAGSRGFAAAAERYFGAPPSALSPAEAAMLTSTLPAPSA